MKKENWILAISIAALILSGATFLLWFCRYEPMKWNWLDVSYGVISGCVTVFVASQIYHSFTLLHKVEEKNKKLLENITQANEANRNEMVSAMEAKIIDYDHCVSAQIRQLHIISQYFLLHHYEEALDGFMEALEETTLINDKAKREDIADGVISYIEEVLRRNANFMVDESRASRYKMILVKVGTKRAISLLTQPIFLPFGVGSKKHD